MLVKNKQKIDIMYNEMINKKADEEQVNSFLVSSLSSLYEIGIINIKGKFICSSKKMNNLFDNIRTYRNFYSHEIHSQNRFDSVKTKDYYNDFTTLINFLSSMKTKIKPKKREENILNAKCIHSKKENLASVKSHQYVMVGDNKYLSTDKWKFYYSDNDKTNNTIKAILPESDKSKIAAYNITKYNEFRNMPNDYVPLSDNLNYNNTIHDIKLDFNFSALFNAYEEMKEKKITPYIVFENFNKGEKLETTIMRVTNKNYIHPELLCELKLDVSQQDGVRIIDKLNNVIASVVSKEEFCKREAEEFELDLFSIKKDVGEIYYKKGRSR